jgi:UDP-N-acetylmuramyl tripeptide synthase
VLIEEIAIVARRQSPTVLDGRPETIEHALASARGRDVVVRAGKGRETEQQFAFCAVPFDDREVARSVLAGGSRRRSSVKRSACGDGDG